MELGFNNFWPTQILYKKFSDTELLSEVLNFAISNKDSYSNSEVLGGEGILNSKDPIIKKFKDKEIIPAFKEYLKLINVNIESYKMGLRGWITGDSGLYNLSYHNHSGASLSSVFYICCEEKDKGGEIVFHDPRSNANRGYDQMFKSLFAPIEHTPMTGDIIVFPSYLYHHVNTYFSKLRIAIPVDMFIINKFEE